MVEASLDDLEASDADVQQQRTSDDLEAASHSASVQRVGSPPRLALRNSHWATGLLAEGDSSGAQEGHQATTASQAMLDLFVGSLPVSVAVSRSRACSSAFKADNTDRPQNQLRSLPVPIGPPRAHSSTSLRFNTPSSAISFARGRARSPSPPRSGLSMLGTDSSYRLPTPPPAFAEHFKYQICSSTLLDPMPKLGRRVPGATPELGQAPTAPTQRVPYDTHAEPPSASSENDSLRPRSESSLSTASSSVVSTTHAWSLNHAPWERAEFAIASLVAIGGISGIWQMVGWLWLEVLAGFAIGICGVLGILAGVLFGDRTKKKRRAPGHKADQATPTLRATQTSALNTPHDEAAPRQSLQATALQSLGAFVEANAELDDEVNRILGALEGKNPDGEGSGSMTAREDVDRALRRLSEEMVAATSALQPFANSAELAGLNAMYGVAAARDAGSGSTAISPVERGDRTAVPDPMPTRSSPAHSTPIRISSSWGRGASAASPGATTARRLRISQSTSHLPQVSIDSPTEDRLTPLPRRSPLPPHRRGLQDGPWSPASPSRPSASPNPRRLAFGDSEGTPSRPSRPARWPSRVMEESEDAGNNPGLGLQEVMENPNTARTPVAREYAYAPSGGSQPAPASPPRLTYRLRELRLSQSGSGAFAAHAPKSRPLSEQDLPLAPPLDDHIDKRVKRRSLQDIGYKRPLPLVIPAAAESGLATPLDLSSTASDPSVSLSRARSLPGRRYGHGPSASVPNATAMASPPPQPSRRISRGGLSRNSSLRSQREVPAPTAGEDGLDHLTTAILKSTFLDMHDRRRGAVCCLLALRFDKEADFPDPVATQPDELEVARYWADIHLQLDEMIRQTGRARQALQRAIPFSAEQPTTHLTSQRNDRHGSAYADFAPPRQTDKVLLDDHIAELLDHMDRARAVLFAVRADNQSGISDAGTTRQWGAVRTAMGNMIADWERGRIVIQRMLDEDSAADTSAQSQDIVTPAQTPGEQDLPIFLDEWVDEGQQTAPAERIEAAQDDAPVEDDATRYLLDSASPAFLPPPGLEAVFEAASTRQAIVARAGPKLGREDRIKAARAAREAGDGASRRRTSDAENQPERSAAANTGDMVVELKSVMSELRRRKETAREVSARPESGVLREL